jgi:hypothetical protein
MIDDFISHLRTLQKADALIGKIWLTFIVRRFGLFAFAGLIAVFGLAVTNAAVFFSLQASLGPAWSAAIVAVVDFAIAAMVMLAGMRAKPASELELAFEIRTMAIQSIQADAESAKSAIARFVDNPLDAAAQKLLIPAITSIMRRHAASKTPA